MNISATLSTRTAIIADGRWRLQVWVSAATNLPPDLFLMAVLPMDPDDAIGEGRNVFYRVCKYADLLNYVPRSLESTPFIRDRALDMLFDTEAACGTFFDNIQLGLQSLIDDIHSLEAFPGQTEEYGLDNGYLITATRRETTTGNNEIQLTVTQTPDSSDAPADVAFFVVSNTSEAAITNANQDAELLRLATPEDMEALGTTPLLTDDPYRTDTLVFAVDSEERLTLFYAKMIEDLTNAINLVSGGGVVESTDTFAGTVSTVYYS